MEEHSVRRQVPFWEERARTRLRGDTHFAYGMDAMLDGLRLFENSAVTAAAEFSAAAKNLPVLNFHQQLKTCCC